MINEIKQGSERTFKDVLDANQINHFSERPCAASSERAELLKNKFLNPTVVVINGVTWDSFKGSR